MLKTLVEEARNSAKVPVYRAIVIFTWHLLCSEDIIEYIVSKSCGSPASRHHPILQMRDLKRGDTPSAVWLGG